MLPQLAAYIRTHALFRPGDRVGVAVSGGADSVALLRGLLELRAELGIVLRVVHLHHGIRGAEADEDERFVVGLAEQFDLAVSVERVDVPAHGQRKKLSLEASARELRYEFFKKLLETKVCEKIATAHTLDDQAETVLLRVLRGTGTRGLAAIPPFRNASPALVARIVRPLLGTRREEIESYLHGLGQTWREDTSNRDPKHLRNRVRHELLPLLEREFNPAVREGLVTLAEIARVEEQYWSLQMSALRPLIADPERIERSTFLALPLALRRRMLVQLADQLDIPVSFEDVELMLHIADTPGAEHGFEGGWVVRSSRRVLEVRRAEETVASQGYDLAFEVPSEVKAGGVCLKAMYLRVEEATRYNSATLLDHGQLELPLRVRNWQPGDRFWPVGSKREEKLKRLFQERRIPAEARSSWPVVLSGARIVWVRDFPVAHGFQALNSTAVRIEATDLAGGETRQD
ncbi:MAG TPA: tRNA lysidine(34) synthetase TilS [Candidatus Koribacter sp.]